MGRKYINNILIFVVRIYQSTFSPYINSNCRFYPTCSEYAILALKKYNIVKACFKIAKRIISCHNFSQKHPVDMP